MSFNNTIVNPSSIFTYKEAVNFINSLNKCNSDNDCPYNSICISNNCIVNFYCVDDDKCAFYETLCDGKPCQKKDLVCKSNSECLSDYCMIDEGIGHCGRNPDYTSGTFTYKDGYNYYRNLNPCKSDDDCPIQSFCTDTCVTSFYCKENDNNICAFEESRKDGLSNRGRGCKVNEDCLSGVCSNGICDRTNYALISRDTNLFGLYEGERCTKNSQCYSNYCKDNACERIQNLAGVGYVLIAFFVILVILAIIIMCCIIKCCNRSNKK